MNSARPRSAVRSIALGWLIGLLPLSQGAADGGFTVTGLGFLPNGSSSSTMGINASGLVVGTGDTAMGRSNAFRGGGSSISSVGVLTPGGNTQGFAINNGGIVAGQGLAQSGSGFAQHAFRTQQDGTIQDLGTYGNDLTSAALAINASGHVAGFSGSGSFSRAVIGYAPGNFADLGTLGGQNGAATAINGDDRVAGWAELSSGVRHAFRSGAGGGSLQDLGTLGGASSSEARGINSVGDVVGFSGNPGASRAFLSSMADGTMIDLGTLPFGVSATAMAINDSRLIVGQVDFSAGSSRAFLWDPVTRSMFDLNSLIAQGSGLTIIGASGINNQNQISATARIDGRTEAILLNPVPGRPLFETPNVAVPEPASIALLGLGVSGIIARPAIRRGRRGLRPGRTAGRGVCGPADASRAR